MLRIGLVGRSGSGKSHILRYFHEFGIESVNTDAVVHKLYSGENPCTTSLRQLFGSDVINGDHSVNRRALANIVFADKEKLRLLNQTVHPFVIREVEQLCLAHIEKGDKAFIIEAPQLFESGLDKNCDLIIAVLADHQTLVERIVYRDNISIEMAEKRLKNQYDDGFFQEHADFIIHNSRSDDPKEQVINILKKIGLTT